MASCDGFAGGERSVVALGGHAGAVWRFELSEPDARGRSSRLACAVCEPLVAALLRAQRAGYARSWIGPGGPPEPVRPPESLERTATLSSPHTAGPSQVA